MGRGQSLERSAPVASESRADAVYTAIKQAIGDFQLMPGDRFSESEWCDRLEVSRTPVRQALHQLNKEGYVLVQPRSGWQVSPLDFDRFDHWYELRRLLEFHAVKKLCESPLSPSALQALDGLVQLWCVAPQERRQSMVELAQLDEEFHCTLVAAAGNPEMARIHREVSERIRLVRRLDFGVADRVRLTYEEHAAILDGIRAAAVSQVQTQLDAHIVASQREVRRITLHQLHMARAQRQQ